MNVLSLCSGVGGMDLGLAHAGWEHAGFCESDGYRRDVLRARFPGVPVWDDLRELGRGFGSQHLHGDLIAGGTPCQDLSVAGRRAGLAGDRSSLFFDFARVVDVVRPGWVLWENVPGAFSSNGGRDFGTVVGTLADLGYGVAWRVLDSRYFGVPQRRRRVFVVGAVAVGDPRAAAERAGEVLAVGSRCPRHPATRGEARADAAVASLSGLGSGGPDDNDGQGGRLVSYALNGKRGKRDDGESETFIAAPLTSGGHPNSNAPGRRKEDDENLVTSFHTTQDPIHHHHHHHALGHEGAGVAQGATVRRLTPTECERLQGFPDNWTAPDELGGPGVYRRGKRTKPESGEEYTGWVCVSGVSDSKRYAAIGDAVTVPVAEWIGRRMLA